MTPRPAARAPPLARRGEETKDNLVAAAPGAPTRRRRRRRGSAGHRRTRLSGRRGRGLLRMPATPVARAGVGRRPGGRRSRRRAIVVTVGIDLSALAVLHLLDAVALIGRHDTVRAGARLVAVDAVLAALQLVGFGARQRSVADAVVNALLVARVTTLDARRTIAVPAVVLAARPPLIPAVIPAVAVTIPTRLTTPTVAVMPPAAAVAPAPSVGTLAVMGLAVNRPLFAVEHAVKPLALIGRDPAVGAGTILVTPDAVHAALQASGLAGRQRAVANAAIDLTLLIRFPRVDATHRLGGGAACGEQGRRQSREWDSSEF